MKQNQLSYSKLYFASFGLFQSCTIFIHHMASLSVLPQLCRFGSGPMLLRKGGSLFNTERCLSELLRISSKEMHAILDASAPVDMPCDSLSSPIDDNAEVWAAGVTYKRR